MHTNPQPEYSEELSMGTLPADHYFAIVTQAVQRLGWQLVSASDYEVVCHTQGNANGSLGEAVTIRLANDAVLFTSRSVNEYYWTDNQNKINAEQFKRAFEVVLEQHHELDKRLKLDVRKNVSALVPSATYMVTPILIYLNVAVFICMLAFGMSPLKPTTVGLLDWGGNFRPSVKSGEWWRLFTYMFLHGGIMHLLGNMYALLYIGAFLEPLMGKLRFAATYVLTGICAGVVSIAIHSYSVGVGASGAIFGMYGVFIALLTTSYIQKAMRQTLLRSMLFFVVFNLVIGLQGNVDNAAHIGGLLSGFIIGGILYPGLKALHPLRTQAKTLAVVAVSVVLLSAGAVHFMTDDFAVYESKMKQFADMEAAARSSFTIRPESSSDSTLDEIKDRAVYFWNEDVKILTDIKQLDLPPAIKTRNEKLMQYCNLYIRLYDLVYRRVKGQTTMYDREIENCTTEIAKLKEEIQRM